MSNDADEKVWQGSSVEIECGDLFVIVRGEMIHPGGMTIFGSQVPPKFTDQYDGVVFEAMEVCGTLVAAKAHFPFGLADHTTSINLADFETMTVTKTYLAQLLTGKREEEKPKKQQHGVSMDDIIKMSQQQQGGSIQGIQLPFLPQPFTPPDTPPDEEEPPTQTWEDTE